ncbi:hypothetical protein PVAR5_6516 [Paecilomyces variotii No. 5]|uniref:Short-chain dehydrogenases/reductase n=1 Tax=Byssochlamys spectabilis (strain No. 5 / NBRC 109023) TaxID=1356009 RepID=V5FJ41_BYSSN|nr:hypothetical protein PVAR5_6516 [Paecilomyces variotii No. 5]
MVSLSAVQASNSSISNSLPPGLVGVFVGATNGIGEATVKQFAKYAQKPRAYLVGRSQEAGDRIVRECQDLNPEGQYIFIKADVSLLRVVDEVCHEIQGKERVVNILFLSAGVLDMTKRRTAEDLQLRFAIAYYSRMRFTLNLLPLLRRAPNLRRVVSVFTATKEGQLHLDDIAGENLSMLTGRPHLSSLMTFSLEALAKFAPEVSFVHDYPGPVKTGIGRELPWILRAAFGVILPFIQIPIEESGERHLFLSTSSRYEPNGVADGQKASGVPLIEGIKVAEGTDGKIGSGVYSVDWDCETCGPKVTALLAKMREEGCVEKVWKHTEGEFKRITGNEKAYDLSPLLFYVVV